MGVLCRAFQEQKENFGCHKIKGKSAMLTVVPGWLTTQGTVPCQQGIQNSSRCVINASLTGRTMWGSSTITSEPFILELRITKAKCVNFKHIIRPPVMLDWH